jgi:hypothetical protein
MSPIAHSGVALLGWQLGATRKNVKTLSLFLLVGNLPDIDFLFHLILGREKTLSLHQAYTHNLFFVILTSALLSLLLPAGRDRWSLILVGLSHILLDIIVIDPVRPVGIKPFFPLSKALYNFGFFPHLQRGSLRVMLSTRNIRILLLEAVIFVLPVFVLFWKKIIMTIKSRAFWTA